MGKLDNVRFFSLSQRQHGFVAINRKSPVETEVSSLQSITAFSKHFRNFVASRIDVVLQDVSVLGNFRTVYRDVIRHWSS